MRVVLDTNIFVSALIRPSSSLAVLCRNLLDGRSVFGSPRLLAELAVVCHRPKLRGLIPPENRREFLDYVQASIIPVLDQALVQICRDPKDDMILDLALAAGADVIVTGDKDLLALHPFRGIAILTPAQFSERYRG